MHPKLLVQQPKFQFLPTKKDDIATEKGIFARSACLHNLKSAKQIIKDYNPSKICTIGGDCSTSTPSFSYLADKYKDELAIVWFDGHLDIRIPWDEYPGCHGIKQKKSLMTQLNSK